MWWAAAGLILVAIGAIGIVVPGLPSTGFFIGAAWCFSRSSTRLESWLLGLPMVGQLISDYRAGLGMPRRAKVIAVAMMWTAILVSAYTLRERPWLPALIAVLGIVGTVVVLWRVPTRERVLARTAALSRDGGRSGATGGE